MYSLHGDSTLIPRQTSANNIILRLGLDGGAPIENVIHHEVQPRLVSGWASKGHTGWASKGHTQYHTTEYYNCIYLLKRTIEHNLLFSSFPLQELRFVVNHLVGSNNEFSSILCPSSYRHYHPRTPSDPPPPPNSYRMYKVTFLPTSSRNSSRSHRVNYTMKSLSFTAG